MRYFEILTELFDRPAAFHWTMRGHRMWKATFVVEDNPYVVNFMRLNASLSDQLSSQWGVAFYLDRSDEDLLWKLTKTGNEIAVFSTILEVIKDFLASEKPERLTFTASKSEGTSREKLYTRLIMTASRVGYDPSRHEDGGEVTFYLTRQPT